MHCKGYYNLEIIANHGHLDLPISGSKNIVTFAYKFDFDFYSFDKSIITSLIQSPLPWNHNSVIDIFYSELIKFLPHPNIIDEENVYLSTFGGTSLDAQSKLTKTFTSSKTIYVQRDILDVVATKLKRQSSASSFQF